VRTVAEDAYEDAVGPAAEAPAPVRRSRKAAKRSTRKVARGK
jgi:hypothetical protein